MRTYAYFTPVFLKVHRFALSPFASNSGRRAVFNGCTKQEFSEFRWYNRELNAMSALYGIYSFAPSRKLYQIGALFTHKNGDHGAISVTKRSSSDLGIVDYEQSLFFLRFSESNTRARERQSRETPSVTRVAICVSRVLLDGLQKKERLLVVYWDHLISDRFLPLFFAVWTGQSDRSGSNWGALATTTATAARTAELISYPDLPRPRESEIWVRDYGKTAIGLVSKTTTLHVHHAFLYISLPSLHDYEVKMPNFTFYGERKQGTANFCFSF